MTVGVPRKSSVDKAAQSTSSLSVSKGKAGNASPQTPKKRKRNAAKKATMMTRVSPTVFRFSTRGNKSDSQLEAEWEDLNSYLHRKYGYKQELLVKATAEDKAKAREFRSVAPDSVKFSVDIWLEKMEWSTRGQSEF